MASVCNSATDGTRTRDPDLGKVVLHQLSHCRNVSENENHTLKTTYIFHPF